MSSDDSTSLGVAMMNLVEILRTVSEAASGFRQQLLDSGWSAEVAEAAAAEVLMAALRQMLGTSR